MAPSPPPSLSAAEAQATVLGYGAASLSAQALAPGYRWLAVGPTTAVPYTVVGRMWLTAGPPVGPEDTLAEGARAFMAQAQAHGCEAVFFGVSQALAQAANLAYMPLGEEPTWGPTTWPEKQRRSRQVASQLRRGKRLGVQILAVPMTDWLHDGALMGQMAALARRWRVRQAMPAMGFVVALHLAPYTPGHRLWLAHVDDMLVGFAIGVPVGSQGLLLEHVIRSPTAPNGTAELLVDAAMMSVAALGWVRLGMVPLAGTLSPLLGALRRLGSCWYNFAGLSAFKNKLQPDAALPLGIAFEGALGLRGKVRRVRMLIAVLRGFAQGNLTHFAWRGVTRGPTPLLVVLTFLLPFWTYGLASLPTARWFVAPWVQHGWVAFDGVLTLALAGALRWPHPQAYRFLAVVVTLDTALTLMEAVMYPGPLHWAGFLMHALGVAAPALSAVVLWGAWRRLRWR